MKTFCTEIACNKIKITPKERDLAAELLRRMVTAKSKKAFQQLQHELDAKVCNKIRSYYDKNWRSIKGEWFTGPKFMAENFHNTTNNQIERLNGKLKSTIKKNSSLEEFVPSLFTVLSTLGNEHDHKALTSVSKRPCQPS